MQKNKLFVYKKNNRKFHITDLFMGKYTHSNTHIHYIILIIFYTANFQLTAKWLKTVNRQTNKQNWTTN